MILFNTETAEILGGLERHLSKRARLTAGRRISITTDGYKGQITLNRALYAAKPAYIDVLRGLSNKYASMLMVGHNPALEQLVNVLTDEEYVMPTYSLVHVQLRVKS